MGQVIFFIVLVGMFGTAIWIVISIFSSRASEPSYQRIALKKGYEIRTYDPYIEAMTIVEGSYSNALYEGFRRIGGYIFGNNKKEQTITMTAPVLNTAVSEKKQRVSFVMPEGSKMNELPRPKDESIELVFSPRQTVAVLRFRGPINARRISQQELKLLQMLQQDHMKIVGKPRSARYNPPWTFPLVSRNEIHVAIDYKNT